MNSVFRNIVLNTLISKIKNTPNIIKSKIKNLLISDSDESKNFKNLIYQLQSELESHPLAFDRPLSFRSLNVDDNPQTTYQRSKGSYIYKAEYKKNDPKTSPRFVVEIIKKSNSATFALFQLFKPSKDELVGASDYSKLKDGMFEILVECLNEIDPRKVKNYLLEPADKKQGICINDKMSLIKDEDEVAKAIIEMLYTLRCKLFHGEIDMTQSNNSIYEAAFKILYILIQEIK